MAMKDEILELIKMEFMEEYNTTRPGPKSTDPRIGCDLRPPFSVSLAIFLSISTASSSADGLVSLRHYPTKLI